MEGRMKRAFDGLMTQESIRPGKLEEAIRTDSWPKNFKIQILEVGYSNDWTWKQKREEKREAYEALEKHMSAIGASL